jgi:type III secretion protein L
VLRQAEAAQWMEGYAFLEQARQEAETLLASTQAQVDAARMQGYVEGQRAGIEAANKLLVGTTEQVNRYLAGLPDDLADLALDIVRRVLGRVENSELVAQLAREALAAFRGQHSITVRVAPEHSARVEAIILSDVALASSVRIEPDAQLSLSQCTVLSPVAVVDASLDMQLDALRRALTKRPADGTA